MVSYDAHCWIITNILLSKSDDYLIEANRGVVLNRTQQEYIHPAKTLQTLIVRTILGPARCNDNTCSFVIEPISFFEINYKFQQTESRVLLLYRVLSTGFIACREMGFHPGTYKNNQPGHQNTEFKIYQSNSIGV